MRNLRPARPGPYPHKAGSPWSGLEFLTEFSGNRGRGLYNGAVPKNSAPSRRETEMNWSVTAYVMNSTTTWGTPTFSLRNMLREDVIQVATETVDPTGLLRREGYEFSFCVTELD